MRSGPSSKRCNMCGQVKPLDDFYRMKGMRDGHRNDCKACNLAAEKARYDADPAAHVERVRDRRLRNPERYDAYRREYQQRPEYKRSRDDPAILERALTYVAGKRRVAALADGAAGRRR